MYGGPHNQHYPPQGPPQPGFAPQYGPPPPYGQPPVMQQPPPNTTVYVVPAPEQQQSRGISTGEAVCCGCCLACCLSMCSPCDLF
ncbi:protein CYSTEINE-RICH TRANSMEMBRANE MODULE 13-like [Athalia rosae]|uniref:protein CYSTEINE-RICH TRANSMEMBRANE MODULE 13-like n=1 Tax=Athalia rosae TaxID=37344 RepID=UPI000A0ED845|nr:protein CYSTEINE-RICH TRANSMEMBRANE MODULE 13-like [Athalia rosae]